MENRLPTSDHLYGLAAECGLKAVMQDLGMTLDDQGRPDQKEYRVHINKLWDIFISFTQGKIGANYSSTLISYFKSNPFSTWDVNQRYYHSNFFNATEINKHKVASTCIISILQQAIINGIIP
jgi:hypothetical protein